MNRLTFLKLFFAFSVFSLFLTSCESDENPIDTNTPPKVQFNDALGYITDDANIALGESFSVYLTATKGSNPMKTLTILEDGVKIEITTDRITFEGNTGVANPLLLLQDNVNSLAQRITIKAHTTLGTKTYDFVVADEKGLTSKVSLDILVDEAVNTINGQLGVGQLFNQGGPAGTGGLDLDSGASTGTDPNNPSSASAEIRDEGIVDVLTDQTWKQQISGMNGSEIRYIKKGQNGVAESFSFDDVNFRGQIAGLWNNGVAFSLKSTDGQRDVSDKVIEGDVFIVKNGDKYYLLYTKEVVVTTTDNRDYYSFDIKL